MRGRNYEKKDCIFIAGPDTGLTKPCKLALQDSKGNSKYRIFSYPSGMAALNGYNALKRKDKGSVKLVIADVSTLGGDGLMLNEKLREIGYEGRIILAAYEKIEGGKSIGFCSEDGPITHDEIKGMGADGVIRLPASEEEFLKMIKNFIQL
ncbi:MAG: hypothetical protein JSV39_00895 [Candidatus Aenigmatarchaeota archaeon]|nr:MAG: hypothetical protein JSV39_00895 [Candidatus Aenigmarchaeota archaeon]